MSTDFKDESYPSQSFFFEISFDGVSTKESCRFMEIGGLNAEIKLDEVKEGGMNTFSHRLPKNVSYPNLILKRGIIKGSSLILDWVTVTLEQFIFSPRTIVLKLLNKEELTLVKWSFQNAYPVAIKIGDFKAIDNAYVIETLEFAYNSFERDDA